MSNNRANRIREMEEARQAGRDAYDEGKGEHSAPHNMHDRDRWRNGWAERQFEDQMRDKEAEGSEFQYLVDQVPCLATRAALEAIWEKVGA